MTEAIGWVATALFGLSYFAKTRPALLRLQIIASLCWIAYGVAIRSAPVIVANIIVASAATYAAVKSRTAESGRSDT